MKAKEIIHNNLSEGYSKQVSIGVVIEKCMIEYAKYKCKEQRNLCSKFENRAGISAHKMAEWAIIENIENAPEPNFD